MRTASKRVLTMALAVLCLAATAMADKRYDVGKLKGAGPVNQYRGRPRLVVSIQTVDGKELSIGVENIDETKYNMDPKKDLLDEIKALKPGDMVKVAYDVDAKDGTSFLIHIEGYTIPPGMELPNAFIFHESYPHSEGKRDFQLVDLKRFEKLYTFAVFGTTDTAGNFTPDPQMMAVLNKLKDGDIVLANVTPAQPYPILRNIEGYTTPKTGTLTDIKVGDLNGNKTTEADIDVGGTAVTVYVPGRLEGKRWVVDSKILGELRRLRPKSLVLFRTSDDGSGNAMLRDIKQAPKPPDAKPPTSTASK